MDRVIFVTEDLTRRPGDALRFCAALVGDVDPERGGFGPTELAAVTMLARLCGSTHSAFTRGARFDRAAVR